MKTNKFLVMTFAAALAMASTSCSNDDIVENGNQQEVVEGQKTWTTLQIKLTEGTTGRAAENGTETGLGDESSISTLDVYIFNANGVLELTKTIAAKDLGAGTDVGFDASKKFPATPVEVTSGSKTFCVILNKQGTVTATVNTTTLADFLQQVQTANTYTGLVGGGLMANLGVDSYGNAIIMSGQIAATLYPGVSKDMVDATYTTDEKKAENNQITLAVDRAAAKVDLKLGGSAQDAAILAVIPGGGTNAADKIADMQTVTYKMHNINTETYYFLQAKDANSIYPTPFYTQLADVADYANNWFDQSDTEWNKLSTKTVYMSPNTHAQNNSKYGNVTYALVKGTYVPVAARAVSGYNEGTKDWTTTNLAGAFAAGQYSLFSYDYEVAFKSVSDKKFTSYQANVQSLVAKAIHDNYSAGEDVKLSEINVYADKTAYDAAVKDNATTLGKSTYYAYLTLVDTDKYSVTMVRWAKQGDQDAFVDTSFDLANLTVALYSTDGTGLINYYRINVYDSDFEKMSPNYYSVLRNSSYHIDIKTISAIGENDPNNVEGEPDEPIEETTTFMQTTINIYKWVAKGMDIDL